MTRYTLHYMLMKLPSVFNRVASQKPGCNDGRRGLNKVIYGIVITSVLLTLPRRVVLRFAAPLNFLLTDNRSVVKVTL